MRTDSTTYNGVAITLHWLIAGLVIFMFFFGLYAASVGEALRAGHGSLDYVRWLFNWHKTLGLLVLLLAVLRLVWRLIHKAPPLPADVGKAEAVLTKLMHVAFYVLIIGIPLIGWVMISSVESTSYFFNNIAFPIPEIWGNSRDVHDAMEPLHEYAAWAIMILMLLHAGAALKHHFINRDDLLARMAPWIKRRT